MKYTKEDMRLAFEWGQMGNYNISFEEWLEEYDGGESEWKETPPPTPPDGISTEDEQLYMNQRSEMGG